MRLIILLLTLLLLAVPAQADTCFYHNGVKLIHSDPFCSGTPPEFLPLAPLDTASDAAAACAYCPICWRLLTQTDELLAMQMPLPAPQRYYNPKGGEMYHFDENCQAVRSKYLPLTPLSIEDTATKGLKPCGACTKGLTGYQLPVYLKTLQEKAAAMPEVWDLPSAADLPEEQAVALATTALRNMYALGVDVLPGDFHTAVLYYPADAIAATPAYYKVCFMTCSDLLRYDAWQVGYYADVHAKTGEILRMDAAK